MSYSFLLPVLLPLDVAVVLAPPAPILSLFYVDDFGVWELPPKATLVPPAAAKQLVRWPWTMSLEDMPPPELEEKEGPLAIDW